MDGADGRTDGADGGRTVHVDIHGGHRARSAERTRMAAVMVGASSLFAAAVLRGAGEWQ